MIIKKFKELEIGKRFRFSNSPSFWEVCVKTSARKYETVKKYQYLQYDGGYISSPLKCRVGTINVLVEELEDSAED